MSDFRKILDSGLSPGIREAREMFEKQISNRPEKDSEAQVKNPLKSQDEFYQDWKEAFAKWKTA
jgi:hypothetical protein